VLSTYCPLETPTVINEDDGIELVVDRYMITEIAIPPVVGALQVMVTLLFPAVAVTDVTGPGGDPVDPPPKVPGVMVPVESRKKPLPIMMPQPEYATYSLSVWLIAMLCARPDSKRVMVQAEPDLEATSTK